MKKLRGSLAAKITAVFLLCAMVVVCVLAVVGTVYLSDMGAYSVDLQQAEVNALKHLAGSYLYGAGQEYREGNTQPQYRNTNLRYTILSADGEELLSTYEGEETLWEGDRQYYPSYTSWTESGVSPEPTAIETPGVIVDPATQAPVVTPTPVPTAPPEAARAVIHVYSYDDNEEYEFHSDAEVLRWRNANALTVRGYVLRDMKVTDDFSTELSRLNTFYGFRTLLPCAAALSLLLGILLFIFLLSAAGHRDSGETITESFLDQIPLDVFTVLCGVGICIPFAIAFGVGLPGNMLGYAVAIVLLLLVGLQFLLYCMSFAVRVKRGTLWQNFLIVRLWRWCGRTLRRLFRFIMRGLRALPLLWRWVLILAALLLSELLFIVGGESEALWVLHLVVLCPAVLFLIWCMRRLRLGAKEIANGNLGYTVETKYLFGELRDHANDLNHIRVGLNAAVEERMKSEHFKSELITNVSHDIKTPLTSIINYVDLLEKEELGNDTAREYVAVLARQSGKLKKLIDDLIEASKASTGVLPVHAERCELGVLLDQCAGEYGGRLSAAGLELVVSKPEAPVTILADGRHMWRVFDNLLNNVVKYALSGTRVYLSLSQEADKAVVTVRNISREALNVSGEELMERFVRGDSSRNTEGSGLGLAIARSLTQLQGGELALTVDGDLFKVTLRFNTI